ncbi:MAG: energy-coupling factor ABC transporter permease [Wenzhouxiangellaceae bacterium]|nr:energy-coupling factor ABC transporter permease [Wenzhouxiangellaceae bacterium]
MNLPTSMLPDGLLLAALALYLPLMLWTLARAPWRLLAQNLLVPVYLGALVLLAGLWSMQIGAAHGPGLHFLGLSAMVLVFGPELALAAGMLVLLGLGVSGVHELVALGVNGLIGAVLPVALATRLHALVYRFFPKHYFVYVLISAHFASMVVIAVVMVTGTLVLTLAGGANLATLAGNYLVFLPIVMLPEGFLNGAIMAMLTAWKPEWVRSFDDRDYIDGK